MQTVSLQTLREMILEVLSDNMMHTRPELIGYAQKRFGMGIYDADQRTTMALQSLLKKGDIGKLNKGMYQRSPGGRTAEYDRASVLEQIRRMRSVSSVQQKETGAKNKDGMEM